MIRKTSADYQREFRKRLRDQGLIKKEVWILPENASQLLSIEKQLRSKAGFIEDHPDNSQWQCANLYGALAKTAMFTEGDATIELIDGVEPVIYMIMHAFGELPIYLSVSGEQMLVEAQLWSKDDVVDIEAFDRAVLQTHKYFPLSTISIEFSFDHKQYYNMFGSLSASSTLANVVLEIENLAINVLQATEAYSEFLSFSNNKENRK